MRTTVTLPVDLYESLRLQAFQQKTSFSGILREKLAGSKTKKPGKGIMGLAGKYDLAGREFDRKEFYGKAALRDLALGH